MTLVNAITPKIISISAILLITIIVFKTRIFAADHGLPYLDHWDEPQLASTALVMLQTGDLNPHFFNYGTFPIYIFLIGDIFHYLHLIGQPPTSEYFMNSLNDIITSADTGWYWEASHPSFFIVSRLISFLFLAGVATSVYLMVLNLHKSILLAFFSALLLAIDSFLWEESLFIRPNIPMALFSTFAVYFSLLYFDSRKRKYFLSSLICCGLATATKYNAILVSVVPTLTMLALHLREGKTKSLDMILLLLVPPVIFFLAMPYAFLDLHTFLLHLGNEIRHYKVFGHPGAETVPGTNHLVQQLTLFYQNIGLPVTLLSGLGLLGLLRNPKAIILMAFPIVFLLVMVQMKVNFHRNMTPIYPIIYVLVASGLHLLYSEIFPRIGEKLGDISIRVIGATTIVVAVATFFYSIFNLQPLMEKYTDRRDTRSKAVDIINNFENVSLVIVAEELRLHNLDLEKIRYPFTIESIADININRCQSAGALCVVPQKIDYYFTPMDPDVDSASESTLRLHYRLFMDMISDTRHFLFIGSGENKTYLDSISIDPGILIYYKSVL